MKTVTKVVIVLGAIWVIRSIVAYKSLKSAADAAVEEAKNALTKQGIKISPTFKDNYLRKMTRNEHELFMKSFYQSEDPTPEQQRIMAKVLTF